MTSDLIPTQQPLLIEGVMAALAFAIIAVWIVLGVAHG